MAVQRQFFDVWLVESDTVYREVPFTVVCDWVQQGRLIEDDQVRPSGTADWKRLADIAGFAAFLPKPEPLGADDQAEALEPVTMEFHRKKKHVDEDDDVDMIPLIDVSMVLLVFFMLTASGVSAAANVPLSAVNAPPLKDTKGLSINIRLDRKDGKIIEGKPPHFGLGEDGKPVPDDRGLNDDIALDTFLKRLNAQLARKSGPVEVTINADRELEDGVLVDLLTDLKDPRKLSNWRTIARVYNGVTERK